MSETRRGYVPEEVKKLPEETKSLGKFENLIKEGRVKQGDFIIWGGMLYKINEISKQKISMEGFDDKGSEHKITIQGLDANSKATDPTNVYTHEISDLDEAFGEGRLVLVEDEIKKLKKEIKGRLEEGENVENLETRLRYFESVVQKDEIKDNE